MKVIPIAQWVHDSVKWYGHKLNSVLHYNKYETQKAIGNKWYIFEDGSVMWRSPKGDSGWHRSKPIYLN